jgi:tripeptidyl-peptidase-1
MAYPTPVIFYSNGNDPEDAFLGFLKHLVSQLYIPQTISISYELGNEQNVPPGYSGAVCYLFAQLAARGISVLVGSGVYGVGAGNCQDDSGNVRFIPGFPSTCMCSVFITATQALTRPPWFRRSLCH